MRDRPVFLRWLLLNAVAVAASAATVAALAGHLHGASRFAVPAIAAIYAAGAYVSGRAAWDADNLPSKSSAPSARAEVRGNILHGLENASLFAWVAQIVGLLSTVAGFWIIFSGAAGADPSALSDRITNGAGVALTGTFAGVFVSLVLTLSQRIVEHGVGAE